MNSERTPNPDSKSSIGAIAVWGGLAGLLAGLGIWFWPAGAVRNPDRSAASAAGRAAGSGSGGASNPSAGTLSDTAPVTSRDPVAEHEGESPRSSGIRYVWYARYQARDYRAALDTILESGLDDDEMQLHLGDLIDVLLRTDWYEERTYPYSYKVDSLLKEPNGRDRVLERWNLARTTVAMLEPSPRKLRLLARMEIAAQILDETAVNLKLEGESPGLPKRREVDEKGNPIGKVVASVNTDVRKAPLFDRLSSVRTIRQEIKANSDALTPRNSIKYLSSNGWGLVRTGLLSLLGALSAGVGGLIVKMYSESIAARMPAPFWSLALLNRFRKKSSLEEGGNRANDVYPDDDFH